MYEELVKRLRSQCRGYGKECEDCNADGNCRSQMENEAADAIEELLKAASAMHTWIFLNTGDEQKAYDECGLSDEMNAALGYSGQFVAEPQKEEGALVRRKRYLYHVTKPENVGSIIKNGLMRSMGGRTTCGVYLSEKPLSWYEPGLDILRVDISGLDGIKANTFLPDSDEVIFWGDIPAWKLAKNGWKNRIEIVTDKYVKKY